MRVGLDIGGTKTDAVALDHDGVIVGRVRRPTGWGPDAVSRTVIEAVAALVVEAGIHAADVRSVGVGMPGQIVPETTRVLHAVNLGVEELDIAAATSPALGVPVRVENDVKAAALGAYALHQTRAGGPRTMGYLNLGTGVAAGIVVDGELWRGAHGAAGEVGHLSIDPAGPACPCGQRGCIEALAGGRSIAERWGRPGTLAVRDVFDAADAGDPRARELRAGLARGVAAAVRLLVLTADVDVVVLGGGLIGLGERLRTDVRAELAVSAAASGFMRSLRLDERIEVLPPGSPAAALGAALIGAPREAEPAAAVSHG